MFGADGTKRPLTFDSLTRSASLPLAGPQRAEIGPPPGTGFLGKPNYFDPRADKSLYPRPPDPGMRLSGGTDHYVPCKTTGAMGVMAWDQGRSHKTEEQVKRELRKLKSRSATPLALDVNVGGMPIMTPPKEPPWGFGGAPARVRAAHVDFYWGC